MSDDDPVRIEEAFAMLVHDVMQSRVITTTPDTGVAPSSSAAVRYAADTNPWRHRRGRAFRAHSPLAVRPPRTLRRPVTAATTELA